jgi:hypothetical protein
MLVGEETRALFWRSSARGEMVQCGDASRMN